MKLYPYTNIKTQNLKPLLISARVLGFLSYILFFGAIILVIFGWLIDQPQTFNIGEVQATMSYPSTTGPAILAAISSLASSVCILALSGLCAAVVSCEYKYTKAVD
ncbi:hypothetical protein CWB96_13435 [Pseudoalteromonas citrea]|uniref:Uncharacterized protein n=1 Tax=Pseudoalteromonas citrea TaxID=43655 RepID=A0A5S3XML5_9GAMM|nr:hypothetical protein [Pseudoalteromonas citrea]TMP39902.1 hypothetical protein CWB97_20425 [Pseudoalteromonas citrea]TMP57532.1 hypothetical protein CWB96_13435 [Pseudoalteromonas citrea]